MDTSTAAKYYYAPAIRIAITSVSSDPRWLLAERSYAAFRTRLGLTSVAAIYNGSTNYALGQRTGMIDSSGRTMWTYDERGRKTREQKIVESDGTFVTGWSYNSADMMATMTYPGGNTGQSGEVVTYGYHPQLALNSMTGELDTDDFTYVESTQYDAAGRVQRRALGESDVINQFIYNDWDEHSGRLEQIKGGSASDATELMNLSYSYDLAGNIMSIVDGKMGPQTQSFTYDEMDRLTSAEANGGTQGTYNSESYTYSSSTGNLSSKGGVSYTYGNSNHKHAVTSLSSGWTYQYDQNGNMTERNVDSSTYSLTYDAYNHLVSVSGAASVDFVYNGDGGRVKVATGSTTTAYIGNYYEWSVDTSTATKYYYAGVTRVAMRAGSSNSKWLLSDQLGSTSVVANYNGSLHSSKGYKAWGEGRFGSLTTAYQFTGQYNEEALGLYYYGARYYDPALGRFTQADTIVPEPGNTLAFDRYSYVYNNPIRYIDPNGHWVESAIDVAFIIYDIYDINQNGLNWENGLSLAADVGGLILPVVTGGGLLVRAVTHADDVGDFARAANRIVPLSDEAVMFGKKIIENLPVQTHHITSWCHNSKWTPIFEEITKKYGLDIYKDAWNNLDMFHRGRHPNSYHNWIKDALIEVLDSTHKCNKARGRKVS